VRAAGYPGHGAGRPAAAGSRLDVARLAAPFGSVGAVSLGRYERVPAKPELGPRSSRAGYAGYAGSGFPPLTESPHVHGWRRSDHATPRRPRSLGLGFRLPADLVKRIDAYAARIASENPGLEVTRALAVKALLTQALDAVEAAPKHRGK
jgi:hypothetical protein